MASVGAARRRGAAIEHQRRRGGVHQRSGEKLAARRRKWLA